MASRLVLRARSAGKWRGCADVPIPLNSASRLFLGRSPTTQVADIRCSRNQAALSVDADNSTVLFEAVGHNPCAVNGMRTEAGHVYRLRVGDTVALLPNLYVFDIARAPTAGDADAVARATANTAVTSVAATSLTSTTITATSKRAALPTGVGPAAIQTATVTTTAAAAAEIEVEVEPPPAKRPALRLAGTSVLRAPGGRRHFAKPGTPAVPLPEGWTCHEDSYLYWEYGSPAASTKVAAFDFDGTVAHTVVGGFDPKAWSLLFVNVPEVLRTYHTAGYKIVIITNESVERFKKQEVVQKAILKKTGRLAAFAERLDVPMQVFCALRKDGYRKPAPGLWPVIAEKMNGGLHAVAADSFYVGDAAGRPRDHDDSDRGFANAVGLQFYTEEEFFGKKALPHPWQP